MMLVCRKRLLDTMNIFAFSALCITVSWDREESEVVVSVACDFTGISFPENALCSFPCSIAAMTWLCWGAVFDFVNASGFSMMVWPLRVYEFGDESKSCVMFFVLSFVALTVRELGHGSESARSFAVIGFLASIPFPTIFGHAG